MLKFEKSYGFKVTQLTGAQLRRYTELNGSKDKRSDIDRKIQDLRRKHEAGGGGVAAAAE